MTMQTDSRERRSMLNGAAHKTRTALIDSVDVRVETFLGETTMTIAALNALKVGAVAPMQAGLNDPVTLRVNGVPIAYGELVAVGDKFGVRITSLTP